MVVNIKTATLMVVMPCSVLGAYCTGGPYKEFTSSIRVEDFSKEMVPTRPDGIALRT